MGVEQARRASWLVRTGHVVVALVLVALILTGCGFIFHNGQNESDSAACHYGRLVLVLVVCVRATPQPTADGTWTYPLHDPRVDQLHDGSILIVAGKSVRRVEGLRTGKGQVTFRPLAVPVTDVIKSGTIPLNADVTPGSIEPATGLLPAGPPPEPRQIAPPPPTPSPSTSPPLTSLPIVAMIAASIRAVSGKYQGPCSGAAGSAAQGPTFETTITVSNGPVVVSYLWTVTYPGASAGPFTGKMTFTRTGRQTQKASFTVPTDELSPGSNTGFISLQVDSPSSVAATPAQLPYYAFCTSTTTVSTTATDTASPSSGSDGGAGSDPGSGLRPDPSSNRPVPAAELAAYDRADVVSDISGTVDGYHLQPPSLTLSSNSFGVGVTAWRQIGLVRLTWNVSGELDDFFTRGALQIVNHSVRNVGLNTRGLRGDLRLSWKLSAALPQSAANDLSLDLPIRLFVEPLLVGDFPVFLAVDIQLHVGLEFASARALSGSASISFGGDQGLGIHEHLLDHATGPTMANLHLDPGIQNVLGLPALQAWVDFPYLSLGDDFYSTGAWLWASPQLEVTIAPGYNQGPCARAEADASGSVGTEFQLFGWSATLSDQFPDHILKPVVSIPPSPACN